MEAAQRLQVRPLLEGKQAVGKQLLCMGVFPRQMYVRRYVSKNEGLSLQYLSFLFYEGIIPPLGITME